MPNYSDLDARRLMESYANDPVGTHRAISQELAAAGYQTSADDPRMTEMLDDWEQRRAMEQYDATIAQIVNDPANADIAPDRFHAFVAACDGNFTAALDAYRANVAGVLADYQADPRVAPGAAPLPGETPGYAPDPNAAPRDNLHRAIAEATRASLARRGR